MQQQLLCVARRSFSVPGTEFALLPWLPERLLAWEREMLI